MYPFAYHRPGTLGEALSLLGDPGARALAGGQTLIPVLKQRLDRPDCLVDIGRLPELGVFSVSEREVVIGATVTHATVAASPAVARAIPALAVLAGGIGDRQVRNMGTIGGSIANNDPAADYPAAIVGLGASVQTTGRVIPGDAFFTGMFETALEPGELVVSVSFPVPRKAGYMKFPDPASRYVLAGAFVALTGDGVRVAINGAGPCVTRWTEAERVLDGHWSAAEIGPLAYAATDLNSDINASAEYRAHLVKVMTERALAA